MISVETITQNFRVKVCDQIRMEAEGADRYLVFTPFRFEDGDHLVIVMKKDGDGRWILSDEGHTFMHLTYSIEEKDLQSGGRQKIILNALDAFSVEDRDGELILPIINEEYGDALYSYVQALLKISDVTYLTRERVQSTFMEDVKRFMLEHIPEERLHQDWSDPTHDPEHKYTVDYMIETGSVPILIVALLNDAQVSNATINLLMFEKWGLNFQTIGIFENQEIINRKVLAKITDVVGKQFSTLHGNEDQILNYIHKSGGLATA